MAVTQIRFPGAAGSAPNSAMWTRATYGGYTSTDVDLDGNGNLRMQCRDTGGGTYSSCRVDSHGKYAVPPESYVEWRALMPTASGVFPGLFLVGNNEGVGGQTWPGVGEIDTTEVVGSLPTTSRFNIISVKASDGVTKTSTGWKPADDIIVPSLGSTWHNFGTFFGANGIMNFTDRKLTSQYTPAQLAAADQTWPFGAAAGFYLAATFSIPTFAGSAAGTTFPQTLLVSGIDIYPLADFSSTPRFLSAAGVRYRRNLTLT